MRLTDEMIQEDDKRFKRQNLLAEFNYCGKEVPKRKSITNDDIRFYAWLCRSAYALLKVQDASEWVSVKDRLPNEATGCVLVCMPKESHSRVRTGQYSEYSKQWYIGDMCGVGGDEPIAWMPLPEPPKEVRE